MKKKKKRGFAWALSALLGFVCALMLGALFYATMVYQLGEENTRREASEQATPMPLGASTEAALLFPGPLLTLAGELQEENVADEMRDGALCRVVSRVYKIEGMQVTAISAYPAAYLSVIAQEGFVPQLVTGFSLAGLDAVYETKADRGMLAARDGDRVYLLAAQAGEQALYALGAAAVLE